MLAQNDLLLTVFPARLDEVEPAGGEQRLCAGELDRRQGSLDDLTIVVFYQALRGGERLF